MTRRTVIYEDKTTGNIYASPEFNGDRTEYEMFQMSGDCDADWSDIQKEFSDIKTLQDFREASGRAQKHYKPFIFYNNVTNTYTELGGEILPVVENAEVSEINSEYIINLSSNTVYKVEGTEENTGFKGNGYCVELCPYCMTEIFNIPADRISLCPHCGFEIVPCSACETRCGGGLCDSLKTSEPDSVSLTAAGQVTEPGVKPKDYICPVCGNEEHSADAKFCKICGEELPIGEDGSQPTEADIAKFERIRSHAGHKIEIVTYGGDLNVSVECLDCCTVLCSVDNPQIEYYL
jgi:hypothetical protein